MIKHLKKWSRPDNYVGAEWPEHFSAGVGQSRNSGPLERANFKSMLKALGGEADTVIVVRESHWLVGWVEWIAIHQDDEKSLQIADQIGGELVDYPVIDDEAFSAEEDEEAQQIWTNCFSDADRLKYVREHRSQFDFASMGDVISCIRGRWFGGYASELVY